MKKLLTKIKQLFQNKFEICYLEGYGYGIMDKGYVYYIWDNMSMRAHISEAKAYTVLKCFYQTLEEATEIVEKIISLEKAEAKAEAEARAKAKEKPKKVKTIYYTTLICTLLVSCAGTTTAHLGGLSHHFQERKGGKSYNDINNNIGLQYEMNVEKAVKLGLIGETWQNSVDKRSVLAGVSGAYEVVDGLDVGIAAGYLTGYRYRVGAFPYIQYMVSKHIGSRLVCLPKLQNSGFCTVSLAIRFN